MKKILTINCGSSSVKSCVYEMPSEKLLCSCIVEKVDKAEIGIYTYKLPDKKGKLKKVIEDAELNKKISHLDAINKTVELITSKEYGVISDLTEIVGIGHRVVQGGEYFKESVIINDNVIDKIRSLIPLAPLHNPAHITGIELCKSIFSNTPQVAVFDNAFHYTMPATSYMYALPYEYYEKDHIRKYGAHGTSHKYVAQKTAEVMNKPLADIKLITCHLGNGCSITAIKDGKVLDTSMGLTPLDGFMMGTRSGAVDPSAITYLMETKNISVAKMNRILNNKSGVLGISGVSSDDRVVAEAAKDGNIRAQLARDMQWYQIRKTIGSYIAAMNGVDAITFTGGIGENCPELRENVVENLSYLGMKINKEANSLRGIDREITTADSKVKTYVIATNEELMIAKDVFNLI